MILRRFFFLFAYSLCAVFSSDAQDWAGLDISNPVLNQHDNIIRSICSDKAGNIYAAGKIHGGSGSMVVGKWNGTSWAALGAGSSLLDSFGTIYQVITDSSGDVYVVGQFGPVGLPAANNNVVKWNGTAWSKVGLLNANGPIVTICFDRHNNLYAAGFFLDGTSHEYVAKWDGVSWTEIGTGVVALNANAQINCLYVDAFDNVYAVGAFTDSSVSEGGNLYVAKWNGTSWAELGGGVSHEIYDIYHNCQIHSMVADPVGNLYVAGTLILDSGYNYVAKWDGISWSKLGTGTHSLNANAGIQSLCLDLDGNLYAAGIFSDSLSPVTNNLYVAKWDGASWSHLGSGFLQNSIRIIYSVCPDPFGNIYAGGTFQDTIITLYDAGQPFHPVYVAKYGTYATVKPYRNEIGSILVFPNPLQDILNITIDNPTAASSSIGYSLYDMSGREYLYGNLHSGNTPVNISDLPSGVYMLCFTNFGEVYKIIKE